MLDFYLGLSNKEKISFLGILFTFITSFSTLVISLNLNKKSSYVNSITNERITSMVQLKQNIASYLSMLKNFYLEGEISISIERLYCYKYYIEFQLNQSNPHEKLIVDRMERINILINCFNELKQPLVVKEIICILIEKGFKKEGLPIPYTEERLLTIEEAKKYIKRLINMELNIVEKELINHIKLEWEKIKSEV
jgi:hypothetical protein